MKYNLITILFLFFFFQSLSGQITVEIPLAIDCGNTNNPIGILSVDQSTTDGNNPPERAIDGIRNGSLSNNRSTKTHVEDNPYFQLNLENQTVLSKISIRYPKDLFPEGRGNYYILISDYPFESSTLSESISSPIVESIYVDNPIESAVKIPLNNKSGKFVRIQMDGSGFLAFTEIELLGIDPGTGGGGEICGNGEDDDCDGRIDCEDNDCTPVIVKVKVIQPTCPTCENGQILINAANNRGSDVLYSIDGGFNFVEFNRAEEYSPDHLFDNLGEGTYNLVIKNDVCEVRYENNPIILVGPFGVSTVDCTNGDLELNSLEGWTTSGEINTAPAPGITISGSGVVNVIPTEGFTDPDLPQIINGNYSPLGEYMLMLGDGQTGNEANYLFATDRSEFCFIVDNENMDFNFTYAIALEIPTNTVQNPHTDAELPYFRYSVTINGEANDLYPEYFSTSGDPLLTRVGNFRVQGWNCVMLDFSEFIGEEVCILYEVRDCSLGGHEGHAYIDGLCSNIEDLDPEIELEALEVLCNNDGSDQRITVQGGGYNSFQWEVGKVADNGDIIERFQFPLREPQYDASVTISRFLDDYQFFSGFTADCGKFFAQLTVYGNCSMEKTESIQFEISCTNTEADYCETLIVCSAIQGDIQMQGEIDCVGCTFDWQPVDHFYDNTVALPVIDGFLEDRFRTYTVTYEGPLGCMGTQEVEVLRLEDAYEVTVEGSHTRCDSEYTITVDFNVLSRQSAIESVLIHDANNNITDEATYVGFEEPNSRVYTVSIDRSNRENATSLSYEIDFDFDNNFPFDEDVCQQEPLAQCVGEGPIEDADNIFTKPWRVYLPNVFSPTANQPENRIFRPYFGSLLEQGNCESYISTNSSIYYAKLEIFHFRGGKIFEIEYPNPEDLDYDPTIGLTGANLAWDGKARCATEFNCGIGHYCHDDGICRDNNSDEVVYHEIGVYTYQLFVRSCAKLDFTCNPSVNCDNEEGQYCSGGEDNVTTNNDDEILIKGDVTLLL